MNCSSHLHLRVVLVVFECLGDAFAESWIAILAVIAIRKDGQWCPKWMQMT
jgi:hypothetical protein